MSRHRLITYVIKHKWKSAMIACGAALLFIGTGVVIKKMYQKIEKINISPRKFQVFNKKYGDYYITNDSIGTGTFASVKRCTRKSDKKSFAVKIIEKKQLTERELLAFKDEIRILQSIKFAYIINMVDVFDSKHRIRMVLELCEGGNLFDQMQQESKRRLDEARSALIVCTIARALEYLHSQHVVHRDIKPENILFTRHGRLKITDFGMAHYLKVPESLHIMHTCCGTPHYVAPEILTDNAYSHQVDLWSLGVILYIILSGYQPFNSESIPKMYEMIIKGEYQFPSPYWDHIGVEAKDLIRKLMCVDAEKRYSSRQVIQHKFITKHVHPNQEQEDIFTLL